MSKKIDCLKIKAEAQKKSLPRLKKALQGKLVHEVEIEDAELSSWLERVKSKASKKKVASPMGKTWSWNSIDNIIKRIKNGQLVQNGDHYELR